MSPGYTFFASFRNRDSNRHWPLCPSLPQVFRRDWFVFPLLPFPHSSRDKHHVQPRVCLRDFLPQIPKVRDAQFRSFLCPLSIITVINWQARHIWTSIAFPWCTGHTFSSLSCRTLLHSVIDSSGLPYPTTSMLLHESGGICCLFNRNPA